MEYPKYPENWEEIKKSVLQRDNFTCCNNPRHNTKPLHVHHIVPLSQGGSHYLNNLITICEDCHRRIHPGMSDEYSEDSNVEHIEIDISKLDFDRNFKIRSELVEVLQNRLNESPIDIRATLETFQYKADEFQQQAIDAEEKTIRILAPAGSGKTQTLINRVIINIKKGLNPGRILMVSFDKSSVLSIQKNMQDQLSTLDVIITPPEIRTLNSFGYSFLQENFSNEYKKIISDFRRRKLFTEIKLILKEKSKETFEALPTNINDTYYLEFFSLLKNEAIDPRNLIAQELADFLLSRKEAEPLISTSEIREILQRNIEGIIWLFKAYEMRLQKDNSMDFDDQKLRTYSLLLDNPAKLDTLQRKYREIIVDEFQDINKLDFELIKIIAKEARLVITGDDDQAIYGFRGCSPKYILELQDNLGRNVTTFKLRNNYRSPKNIVKHSTKLIRNNTWREEKDPIPAVAGTANIKVVSTLSAGIEAKLIVDYIEKVKRMNIDLNFDDIAILYRTNAQSLPIQIEFILNDIPYFVRQEHNILSNDVLEKLLGFLRLKIAINENRTQDPNDCVLGVRSYFEYVNNEQREKLLGLFAQSKNFRITIASSEFLKILEKARNSRFNILINEAINANSLTDTLHVLSGFNGMKGMVGSLEDVMAEKVPLGEIFDIAINFKGNVNDFLETIERAIRKAREKNLGKDEDTGVRLFTYFQSKGLQFHTIILASCNDGLIPHKKANIEDERRLFYVAMTRATSNLLISYVNNSCGNSVNPSRFINEAGL